jgi:hypothetical protein
MLKLLKLLYSQLQEMQGCMILPVPAAKNMDQKHERILKHMSMTTRHTKHERVKEFILKTVRITLSVR